MTSDVLQRMFRATLELELQDKPFGLAVPDALATVNMIIVDRILRKYPLNELEPEDRAVITETFRARVKLRRSGYAWYVDHGSLSVHGDELRGAWDVCVAVRGICRYLITRREKNTAERARIASFCYPERFEPDLKALGEFVELLDECVAEGRSITRAFLEQQMAPCEWYFGWVCLAVFGRKIGYRIMQEVMNAETALDGEFIACKEFTGIAASEDSMHGVQ